MPFDRSEPTAAGVVDQHVDAAEVLLGGLHRALHLRRVGEFQRHDENAVAVLLGPRRQLLRAPGGEYHAVPGLECRLGERHPEAAGVPPVMNHRLRHGSITNRLINAPSSVKR